MIIALLSRKGGVGKTTTAVNLAAALARQRRVLLVDLDPQACASRSLGICRTELAPSVADVLARRVAVGEAVRETGEGPDLLTASVDLDDLDPARLATPPRGRRPEAALAEALTPVRELYDFVVIDPPVTLGVHARLALAAADHYLLPTQLDFLAREGMENLSAAVARLCQRLHSRARSLGIVPTMVQPDAECTAERMAELRQVFGQRVLPWLRRHPAFADAPEHGATVLGHSPDSDAAADVLALADAVLDRIGDREDASAATPRDRHRGVSAITWMPPLRPSEN